MKIDFIYFTFFVIVILKVATPFDSRHYYQELLILPFDSYLNKELPEILLVLPLFFYCLFPFFNYSFHLRLLISFPLSSMVIVRNVRYQLVHSHPHTLSFSNLSCTKKKSLCPIDQGNHCQV